jgi:hypothetical protein
MHIMMGSLLGDGYLEKGKKNKNARFKFKQCYKHRQYVEYIRSQLGECASSLRIALSRKPSRVNGKINHSTEAWSGEYLQSAYFWTKCDPIFTDLWKEWYKEGRKTVPRTIRLNPTILAHWFAQDGSNNVTNKSKGVFLYTNGFTQDEAVFLANRLNEDCELEAKVYRGPIIRIMSGSYFFFMDMVRDTIAKFDCFDHKIDTSLAPANKTGEVWRGPKLNMLKAAEIRQLYSTKEFTLNDIAIRFGVSTASIGKIVNFQMYKPELAIAGNAEVKVGYKYGN